MEKKIKTKRDSQRMVWIDVVKIIAIYLVVVLHNSVYDKQPSIVDTLEGAVVTTCVPLFIMISGALLLGKKESYPTFLKKRIKKVLIPWIAWTCIYMYWHVAFDHYPVSSLSDLKYFFELTFLTQLWFLPLIFGLYLLTPMFRLFIQAAKLRDIVYITFLWFFTISLLPLLHDSPALPLLQNPSNDLVRQVVYFSGYFLLGYLFIKIKLSKHIILLSLLSIAFVFLWIVFFKTGFVGFLSPAVVILTIACFTFIKKYFTDLNFSNKIVSIISTVGKATFGIYLIHQLVMWILKNEMQASRELLISISPAISGPVIGLFIFLVSFIFVYLLQKTPLFKYLVP